MWYVSVSLKPKLSPAWIVQLKRILVMACVELGALKVRRTEVVMLWWLLTVSANSLACPLWIDSLNSTWNW
jgi:hypothetical protein